MYILDITYFNMNFRTHKVTFLNEGPKSYIKLALYKWE